MTVKKINNNLYCLLSVSHIPGLVLRTSMYFLSFNPQNNPMREFLLSLFMYKDTDEPKRIGEYFCQ